MKALSLNDTRNVNGGMCCNTTYLDAKFNWAQHTSPEYKCTCIYRDDTNNEYIYDMMGNIGEPLDHWKQYWPDRWYSCFKLPCCTNSNASSFFSGSK